jgi:tRNA nucleotidyltransferase (CCA-adding enzyme)
MEIYIVGGAVRDELLGKIPKDIDYVVVGATPEAMIERGFSQVGADFPVFLHPESGDEYALARTERKVGVGYHGFDVQADESTTLADDLSRRDLTINAMAKAEDGTIHDPFGGQNDLKNKMLRHVSPAFAEDPLRVVRLARFYARFSDFDVAEETIDLARDVVLSGELNHLPHERFWAELEKVMSEEKPYRFFQAARMFFIDEEVDFFQKLLGDFDGDTRHDMMATLKYIVQLEQDPSMRLMYFTALNAVFDSSTIKTAPMATQNLFANIQRVRNMSTTSADEIFDILQSAKAWSQSPDIKHLIVAMCIAEHAGEFMPVGYLAMGAAWEATKTISSEMYSDQFSGKALGEAIKNGRKDAINKMRVE